MSVIARERFPKRRARERCELTTDESDCEEKPCKRLQVKPPVQHTVETAYQPQFLFEDAFGKWHAVPGYSKDKLRDSDKGYVQKLASDHL